MGEHSLTLLIAQIPATVNQACDACAPADAHLPILATCSNLLSHEETDDTEGFMKRPCGNRPLSRMLDQSFKTHMKGSGLSPAYDEVRSFSAVPACFVTPGLRKAQEYKERVPTAEQALHLSLQC